MISEINLSQLLAIIAVSGSVKRIELSDGDLVWLKMESVDVTRNSHVVSIQWKRSQFCGSDIQRLCMMLEDMRIPYRWFDSIRCNSKRFLEPVFHAYYYEGDNCNQKTRPISECIANNIDIIDDIGLVGNGGSYKRKNLLIIDPNQIFSMKVNNQGRWETGE